MDIEVSGHLDGIDIAVIFEDGAPGLDVQGGKLREIVDNTDRECIAQHPGVFIRVSGGSERQDGNRFNRMIFRMIVLMIENTGKNRDYRSEREHKSSFVLLDLRDQIFRARGCPDDNPFGRCGRTDVFLSSHCSFETDPFSPTVAAGIYLESPGGGGFEVPFETL